MMRFSSVADLVAKAAEDGASDIHLVCGIPPKYRLRGDLACMCDEALTHEECEAYAKELAGELYPRLGSIGELDLAREFGGRRVRVNLFFQQEHLSAAIRLLSSSIPQLENLGLPPVVSEFPSLHSGIVLVTGETGSGKSTTLAALPERINQTRDQHIITLEDPIEYVYTPARCVINQREIGRDTRSYSDGLRAILREDPDVILIGEMRDLDTIETALTAAETGHLVFATLHTGSAADSVDRIVNVFPEGKQRQIRLQLSMTLRAVLSQQLVRTADVKGRVLACETLIVTSAVKNLIREGKTPQIANALSTSAKEGGITMDNFLINLCRARRITPQSACDAARDPDYVRKSVGTAAPGAAYPAYH
ncbi:MAG: PilT/PilU family type 4a pilus ATPase [Oscillospiraceae bacterium]|nr:PilT/PilU family type 4a pilus ATPase [Oscillospiraceae bacterium]